LVAGLGLKAAAHSFNDQLGNRTLLLVRDLLVLVLPKDFLGNRFSRRGP
jgi:hypothetical protein